MAKKIKIKVQVEVHSLITKHRLLDHLKEQSCDEMMVWSPYFSYEFTER